MNALEDIIDDLVTRTKTKRLNLASERAEFHRGCILHYRTTVLPQFEQFQQHLAAQGVVVAIERLGPLDENVLESSLVIEHGVGVSVLQLHYDFQWKDARFAQTGGITRQNVKACRTFVNFEKVTALTVYDVVEQFVRSVFADDARTQIVSA